jgi:hypothetical protein
MEETIRNNLSVMAGHIKINFKEVGSDGYEVALVNTLMRLLVP